MEVDAVADGYGCSCRIWIRKYREKVNSMFKWHRVEMATRALT